MVSIYIYIYTHCEHIIPAGVHKYYRRFSLTNLMFSEEQIHVCKSVLRVKRFSSQSQKITSDWFQLFKIVPMCDILSEENIKMCEMGRFYFSVKLLFALKCT